MAALAAAPRPGAHASRTAAVGAAVAAVRRNRNAVLPPGCLAACTDDIAPAHGRLLRAAASPDRIHVVARRDDRTDPQATPDTPRSVGPTRAAEAATGTRSTQEADLGDHRTHRGAGDLQRDHRLRLRPGSQRCGAAGGCPYQPSTVHNTLARRVVRRTGDDG